MKILHTSDWHLGRSFGSVSLHDTQVAFCEWLLAAALAENVELLVVAGDLYDRSIPPQESVVLWRETLRAFHEAGITVVAIAGNHDGADRVSAFDGLTDGARVFVRGGYGRAGEILTLEFPDGPLDIALVPFLDPQLAPPEWKAQLAEADIRPTHESVLQMALDRARASSSAPRSIAVVHAFVTGATPSDSERTLSVGGTDVVSAAVLGGFSYVALGHLHRPQVIGDVDTIRYSGTPIPYSFSEEGSKSIVLIDLTPEGVCVNTTIAVPVGRQMATIIGRIDELLADGAYPEAIEMHVKAVLTDPEHVVDAKSRLAARYPFIIDVVPQPKRETDGDAPLIDPDQRAGLSPLETVETFWIDVVGTELAEDSRSALIEVLDRTFVSDEAAR